MSYAPGGFAIAGFIVIIIIVIVEITQSAGNNSNNRQTTAAQQRSNSNLFAIAAVAATPAQLLQALLTPGKCEAQLDWTCLALPQLGATVPGSA